MWLLNFVFVLLIITRPVWGGGQCEITEVELRLEALGHSHISVDGILDEAELTTIANFRALRLMPDEASFDDGLCRALDLRPDKNPLIVSNRTIFDAIDQGQLNDVNVFLSHGESSSVENSDGMTPLIHAVVQGKISAVDLLLSKGFDPQQRSSSQVTPLVAAVAAEQYGAVEQLLRNGAEVDTIIQEKETALTIAASKGDVPVMQLLLAGGADVNLAVNGETAFDRAMLYRKINAAYVLARAGADVSGWYDNLRLDPVEFVVAHTIAQLKLVLKYGIAESHDARQIFNILRSAEKTKRLKAGRRLRERSYQTVSDNALVSAVGRNLTGDVKSLLETGSDIHVQDESGNSPLRMAIRQQHLDLVQLLLSNGANPNEKYDHGLFPLYEAADIGNLDIISLLIADGAEVNAKTDSGHDALMAAVDEGHDHAVELLLYYGVDPNDYGPEQAAPLTYAIFKGHHRIARSLLEAGADPNYTDRFSGKSLLYRALERKSTEVLELLLLYDVDVDFRTSQGDTLLNKAIEQQGRLHTYLYDIISRSYVPDQPDRHSRYPLLKSTHRNLEAVVWALLRRGANPDTMQNNWRSAWTIAAEENREPLLYAFTVSKSEADRILHSDLTDSEHRSGDTQVSTELPELGYRKNRTSKIAHLQNNQAGNEKLNKIYVALNQVEKQKAKLKSDCPVCEAVSRRWRPPAHAKSGSTCLVNVLQIRTGDVVGVDVLECTGDGAGASLARAVEKAIWAASPLPVDRRTFKRRFQFNFVVP